LRTLNFKQNIQLGTIHNSINLILNILSFFIKNIWIYLHMNYTTKNKLQIKSYIKVLKNMSSLLELFILVFIRIIFMGIFKFYASI